MNVAVSLSDGTGHHLDRLVDDQRVAVHRRRPPAATAGRPCPRTRAGTPRSPEKCSASSSADSASSPAAGSTPTRASHAWAATSLSRIPSARLQRRRLGQEAHVDGQGLALLGREALEQGEQPLVVLEEPGRLLLGRRGVPPGPDGLVVLGARPSHQERRSRSCCRVISAPLPRCESTCATVHSEAPLGPFSWSAESGGHQRLELGMVGAQRRDRSVHEFSHACGNSAVASGSSLSRLASQADRRLSRIPSTSP